MSASTASADHGHGHDDRPWYHKHHFDTMNQQVSSVTMGMWLFLVTEVLLFSGLFLAYAWGRYQYPETWLEAHEHLNWKLGALNTVILITSSFTAAMSVRAIQLNKVKQMLQLLAATFLLAGGFLIVKYIEYGQKFAHGFLPGQFYNPTHGLVIPGAPETFFGIYFITTGLHGVHVLAGMITILWLMWGASKGRYNHHNHAAVHNGVLYWHLVDLVWIFLFPLLYLVK